MPTGTVGEIWTEYIFNFWENDGTKQASCCFNLSLEFNVTKVKAYYFMKVGLVDLGTLGGKIKFEFCRPALRCLDSQNSNLIFPP